MVNKITECKDRRARTSSEKHAMRAAPRQIVRPQPNRQRLACASACLCLLGLRCHTAQLGYWRGYPIFCLSSLAEPRLRSASKGLAIRSHIETHIKDVLLHELSCFGAPYHPFAYVLVVPFFSRMRPAAVRNVTWRRGNRIQFGQGMPSTQWTSGPLQPFTMIALVVESCPLAHAVRDWRMRVGRIIETLPSPAESPCFASSLYQLELLVLTNELCKAAGTHVSSQQAPCTLGSTWVDPSGR